MDLFKLFRANADITRNYIDIPSVYNQALPRDCSFEIATSNMAQQLRLYRTNDIVGHKFIFYAYDSSKDKIMEGTRRLFIQFVKKHLGFSDDSIIMID